MDFDDFLQDQPGEDNNEQNEGFFEEIPEDLFSDLSIQVSFVNIKHFLIISCEKTDENRSKKDSVIFLVDCRKSFFEPLPDSTKVKRKLQF